VVARQVASRVGAAGRVAAIDISPNMLAVARSVAAREQRAIDWHEGRAEELPFPTDTFDLVLCQFGLMFFNDRQRALAEMRRGLRGSGRIALSVWQGIDRHPFYRTLDDAIQRRLGMPGVAAIFALGDAAELRAMVTSAGFRDVVIEQVSMTSRFPHPEAFLAGEIDVDTAAIPAMQHLDSTGRQAVTAAIHDDMTGPLREVTDGDHVVIPFHAHIVRARC
jgi:ubiquinone/menaquinone biosynthesis C-methylase UbiE